MTESIYSEEILRNALAESVQSMEMEIEEAVIIEDLDPKHSLRCNRSSETANEMGYKVIEDWPPSSPDLNPIEQVWA